MKASEMLYLLTGETRTKNMRIHKRLVEKVDERRINDELTFTDVVENLLARYAVGELDIIPPYDSSKTKCLGKKQRKKK